MHRSIKKSKAACLEDIYKLISITHQHVNHWHNNSASALTKGFFKYNVILNAGDLFDLTDLQMEDLANKAGLSLKYNNKGFTKIFDKLLSAYPGKMIDLCGAALVSERMLRYIKLGNHIKKESILSLLIAMEQDIDNIQVILKAAGFILSKSLPQDVVIAWMMENELSRLDGRKRVMRLNDIFYSLVVYLCL